MRKSGILSYQLLKKAVQDGIVRSDAPFSEGQFQPASLDLRLGPKAYRLVSSFLPENKKVIERLHMPDIYGSDLVMYEIDITQGGILEKGHVYLIPLKEELNLPRDIKGRANPKSTTGRLDIFARVITDSNPRFDDIAPGYRGRLFVEVMPRSFTIRVKEGLSLVQIRLVKGSSEVSDNRLKTLHRDVKILYDHRLRPSRDIRFSKGIFMSVDLSGEKKDGIIGYKTKKNSHVVDLTRIGYYNIEDFWEPIYRNSRGTLILEPEEFYILSSKERIRIPPQYAAEMVAYEAGSGELRTHYAGFFDPGFGYGRDGEVKGTKAVMEVRAHDVPFMVSDGQTFCKLLFERLVEIPQKVYGPKIGSSYQYQGITLSKHFKNP